MQQAKTVYLCIYVKGYRGMINATLKLHAFIVPSAMCHLQHIIHAMCMS